MVIIIVVRRFVNCERSVHDEKTMIFDGGQRSLKSSVELLKNLKIVSNNVAVGEETNGRQYDTIPPETGTRPM